MISWIEMKTKLPDDYDAFKQPRKVQPGCQHLLGCKCEPPFWLRDPTKGEQRRYWTPPTQETST